MVLSTSRWVGKAAIVTGASVGIGAAIAEALVDAGINVVGIARRVELIEEQAKKLSGKKGKLYAIQGDITKEEDIIKAFKWTQDNLGPVHILINNAGLLHESLFVEGKTEDWRREFDINVIGLSIASREAIKVMRENNINGHIIHLNSIAGHRVFNVPRMNVYAATKHAVSALTETMRYELASLDTKIKVTSISPGFTISEMTILNPTLSNERRKFLESKPMLKAEDIADGVLYVLSTPEHVQVHELTIKPVGEPF